MSTPARKRLMRDFKRLQTDPPAGISGTPSESNIMAWHAVIFGPEGTPWEGGTFKLTIAFSEEYPNKAPVVKFVTKMFHPNVYNDGSICLDILQNQWSPIYDVGAILTSIQSLLCDPNPNSPANSEAADALLLWLAEEGCLAGVPLVPLATGGFGVVGSALYVNPHRATQRPCSDSIRGGRSELPKQWCEEQHSFHREEHDA